MSQKCYNPDGTDRNLGLETPVYLPCTGNGAVGPNFHCCAFPSSEAGHHDTCLSNGLCSDGGGQIWRESCTDPTWQDAACKHVCNKGIDWNGASMAGNDEKLTQCGDGNWCCGDVNQTSSCCASHQGVSLSRGYAIPAVNASLASTATISATSTQGLGATQAMTTQSVAPAAGSSTNVGAIVGGILGGIVALAIVGIALFLLKRRRRKPQASARPEQRDEKLASTSDWEDEAATRAQWFADVRQEMPAHEKAQPQEMDATIVHEADSTQVPFLKSNQVQK